MVGLNDLALLSERITQFTQTPYLISEELLHRFNKDNILDQYQDLLIQTDLQNP